METKRTRVFVYWNLHRHCWSVKNLRTGRIMGHALSLVVQDCVLVVSEAGRQRVLREKRKNVHAGIRGYLVLVTWVNEGLDGLHSSELDFAPNAQVTYNPYLFDSFVRATDTTKPVKTALRCWLTNDRKVFAVRGA